MGTYKNDYTKEEDEVLWEIHEIRRKLNKDLKNKTVDQINKEALAKFFKWKKQVGEELDY
jgi:histone H3/H4